MTSLQRFRLGLIFFAVLPVFSFLNFFWQNAPNSHRASRSVLSRFVAPPEDDWGIHGEEQFRRARAFLPGRGIIGFVSDEKDGLFLVRYYSAQHALAPLVLRYDARAPLVLCLFRNARHLKNAQQSRTLSRWTELDGSRQKFTNGLYTPLARSVVTKNPLVLVRDFGDGLVLFRRSP